MIDEWTCRTRCGWRISSAVCPWSPTWASACRRVPRCEPAWWPRAGPPDGPSRRRRPRQLLHGLAHARGLRRRRARVRRGVRRRHRPQSGRCAHGRGRPGRHRGHVPARADPRHAARPRRPSHRVPVRTGARVGPAHRHRRVRGGPRHGPPAGAAGVDAAGAVPRLRALGRRLGAARVQGRRHRRRGACRAGGDGRRVLRPARRRRRGRCRAAEAGRRHARPGRGGRLRRPCPRGHLAEADDGDPHDLMLAVEPAPRHRAAAADLADVAAAFGDLADVKMPFLHGHSRQVAELAAGGARRLGLAAAEVGAWRSPACCTTSAGSASPTRCGRSRAA